MKAYVLPSAHNLAENVKSDAFFENEDKLFKKVEMNNLAIHESI